ncbi:MAG: ABC transporter permease subunit [Aeromicrobium erythreum]
MTGERPESPESPEQPEQADVVERSTTVTVDEEHDLAPIGPAPTRRRRRRRAAASPGRRRSGWPLLAPTVLVLAALTLWPLGLLLWTSLRRSSSTVGDDTFVGLDNLTGLLGDRSWWLAVSVTLLLVVVAVGAQLVLASVVAASIRRLRLPLAVVSVLLLAPFALLPVVTASVWSDAVTSGVGPAWFGYDGGSSAAAAFAVVSAEVWRGTGVTAVILLVGLTRVDRRLIDSAVADGATSWQRLLRVTWPAAAPAVAVAVLYRATDALRALEGPLLAAPSGGVRTVPVLTWEATFESFERGLGAASAVLLLVLAGLVAAVLVAVLRPGRRA